MCPCPRLAVAGEGVNIEGGSEAGSEEGTEREVQSGEEAEDGDGFEVDSESVEEVEMITILTSPERQVMMTTVGTRVEYTRTLT